jgi:hypothetical protein
MHFLARRNERKVRSEWEGLLRDTGEKMLEALGKDCWAIWTFLDAPSYSWGTLARRTVPFSRVEMPDIIPFGFVCRALFDYLPVRCWVCNRLILKKVNYRKDDVQHFLEERKSSQTIEWLPRPYCSRCHLTLGFERYGSRVLLTRKC